MWETEADNEDAVSDGFAPKKPDVAILDKVGFVADDYPILEDDLTTAERDVDNDLAA